LAESTRTESGLAAVPQFTGVIIGPLAWGADLLISYALVYHACSSGHHYLLHVVSAVCLAVALSGALLSWRQFQQVRRGNDEGVSALDRSHFLALLGIASSIWFTVVILATALPRWILSPCD
jgi:hypothetical protein